MVIFESIATLLMFFTINKFYLCNFSYIGTCLAIGVYLYVHKVKYARNVVQFAVWTYMLVYLCIVCNENMQIEGFGTECILCMNCIDKCPKETLHL